MAPKGLKRPVGRADPANWKPPRRSKRLKHVNDYVELSDERPRNRTQTQNVPNVTATYTLATPKFLGLPPELRFKIYGYLMSDRVSQKRTPLTAAGVDNPRQRWISFREPCFQTSQSMETSLFTVCKHLHTEVTDFYYRKQEYYFFVFDTAFTREWPIPLYRKDFFQCMQNITIDISFVGKRYGADDIYNSERDLDVICASLSDAPNLRKISIHIATPRAFRLTKNEKKSFQVLIEKLSLLPPQCEWKYILYKKPVGWTGQGPNRPWHYFFAPASSQHRMSENWVAEQQKELNFIKELADLHVDEEIRPCPTFHRLWNDHNNITG